jgi:hypothetical protein
MDALPAPEEDAMARSTQQTTYLICLTVFTFILLNLLAAAMKIDPPPVPLDPEGHTAPYSDSPLFGI